MNDFSLDSLYFTDDAQEQARLGELIYESMPQRYPEGLASSMRDIIGKVARGGGIGCR